MNKNKIIFGDFSNPESRKLYETQWESEPEIRDNFYLNGRQCGGCAFYAKFDSDWGLCCHSGSRHHLETVFEHFTCSNQVNEGWDAHSFIDLTKIPAIEKSKRMKVDIPEQIYDAILEQTDGDHEDVYLKIVETLAREFSKKGDSKPPNE